MALPASNMLAAAQNAMEMDPICFLKIPDAQRLKEQVKKQFKNALLQLLVMVYLLFYRTVID